MEEKAVVILSGGLDSTVLTYFLKRQGYELVAITFDYGQRHKKEIEYAKRTTKKLNIPHHILKIPLANIFESSALLNKNINIPKKDYSVETQKVTVVPNRNMIMLSFAAGFAEDRGIDKVFYAAHKNDYAVYPDCRPEFVSAVSLTTQLGTYNKVRILAPFVDMYKWEIVKLGTELGVPFEDTWSCYEGREKHCGVCGTCRERKIAFSKAGIEDPTEYEVDIRKWFK